MKTKYHKFVKKLNEAKRRKERREIEREIAKAQII